MSQSPQFEWSEESDPVEFYMNQMEKDDDWDYYQDQN